MHFNNDFHYLFNDVDTIDIRPTESGKFHLDWLPLKYSNIILGSLDSEGRPEPKETSVVSTRLQYLLPAVIRVLKRFRVRQKDSEFFDIGMTRDQETFLNYPELRIQPKTFSGFLVVAPKISGFLVGNH